MDKLHSIWLFLRRQKYIVVTLIFFLLIGFAGDSSLWQRFCNYRRMVHLENEIKRYTEEYENDTKQLILLKENPVNMERIARERYLMKKSNEDIFVFEEDLPKTPTILMEQVSVESSGSSAVSVPVTLPDTAAEENGGVSSAAVRGTASGGPSAGGRTAGGLPD